MAASFHSDNAQKGASRRELFDASVICIGYQNVSAGINSNANRRIKFALAGALAAFKHVADTLRQGTELGRRCVWHLVNNQSVVPAVFKHFREVGGVKLLVWTLDELTLLNRIVVSHITDAILFQKMIYFPRILALEQICVKPVVLARVVTG